MSRPPTTGAIPGDVNRIRRALYDLIATLKQAPGYNNFEWGAFIFLAPNGAIYASLPQPLSLQTTFGSLSGS